MTAAQGPGAGSEPEGYAIPAKAVEAEKTIRNSRFVARAEPVGDRNEALECVASARARHPEARHHCWAFLVGDPGSASAAATDDDGEPGGTAGRPILRVVEHKGIGDVLVVVSRYFGGIKLGAGGLTRAYAQATEAVLAALPLAQRTIMLRCLVSGPFAAEHGLRRWADVRDVRVDAVRYSNGVNLWLSLPRDAYADLAELCAARSLTLQNEPEQP
ncbi:MAG: YigZ family protein [Ectothiorhodospiraceae bacterium]